MDEWIRAAVDRLGSDRTSGASEIVPLAIDILRGAARLDAAGLVDVARSVGRAQPSMAAIWHAALAAVREPHSPGALDQFERRWRRAGDAMVRAAVELLAPRAGQALRLATWSSSGAVLSCARALARRAPLAVACAEGRPMFEGRRLATVLAGEGVRVELFTDAGVGEALARSTGKVDAVLIGADAVAPDWVVNKCGSSMLAALAARAGVPIYVAATRDKFVDDRVAALLQVAEHGPAEVWDGPPPGVAVRNVYFERMPADLVSAFITDAGVLSGDMLAEACRAACAGIDDRLVDALR